MSPDALGGKNTHRQDGHVNMGVGPESAASQHHQKPRERHETCFPHYLQGTVTSKPSLLTSGLWKNTFLLISNWIGSILFQHHQELYNQNINVILLVFCGEDP